MVIEDHVQQRSLITMRSSDQSQPCKLDWWLEHNPQGVVKCNVTGRGELTKGAACKAADCSADVDDIMNGYVRTMLATTVLGPQAHEMSALCIEMGCRARVTKTRFRGSLVQKAKDQAPWVARRVPRQILVIGLGSSTMALWLRKYLPDTTVHVAELVPEVVSAAPCFGLDTSDPKVHLHVGDGRAFLNSSSDGGYDAILIDAFDPDASLPACFRTHEFFGLAKRKLAEGGVLSFNLLSGKASLRVLESLAGNFPMERLWVGDAPGAEGVQEVILAYNHGVSAKPGDQRARIPETATRWLEAASVRPVPAKVLDGVQAFADKTECPSL